MAGIAKPILLDFPDSFETERLFIRAPRIGDGNIMNEAIRESLPNLKQWMHWAQRLQTVAETEERVRQSLVRWILREDLWMLLFRKSDGVFVGRSGLHNINWSIPAFEIGYWADARFAGQGYMSEAVAGITTFAFTVLGAERIEIRCDSLNERSAAVARRAHYTLEATLRHDDLSADGSTLRNALIFSMLRTEYLQQHPTPKMEQ